MPISPSGAVSGAPRAWLRLEGLAVPALLTGRPPVMACLWAAHIGFDRGLGYGLKYPSGFADTHLGRIGRRPAAEAAPAGPG